MSLPKIEVDLGFVSKLDDNPNDVGGLDAAELKAVFDKAGLVLQEYLNDVLIPQIESDIEAAALGIGGSGTIGVDKLPNKSIGAVKLEDGAVTTPILADKSVTGDKVADDCITTEKIADNAVTTAQIADNTVTREKIPDQAISTAKIFPGAVTSDKIPTGAITKDKIDSMLQTQVFKVDVPTKGWTGSLGNFTIKIPIEGIRERDLCTVNFSTPDSLEEYNIQIANYDQIWKADIDDGFVTLTSKGIPKTGYTIKIIALRLTNESSDY